ncbi:MAG: hypothetical protein AAGP08_13255 [Pseudomonadota bacterium]
MRGSYKDLLLGALLGLMMALGWYAALTLPAGADAVEGDVEGGGILVCATRLSEAQSAGDTASVGSFMFIDAQLSRTRKERFCGGHKEELRSAGSFPQVVHWLLLPELASAEDLKVDSGTVKTRQLTPHANLPPRHPRAW